MDLLFLPRDDPTYIIFVSWRLWSLDLWESTRTRWRRRDDDSTYRQIRAESYVTWYFDSVWAWFKFVYFLREWRKVPRSQAWKHCCCLLVKFETNCFEVLVSLFCFWSAAMATAARNRLSAEYGDAVDGAHAHYRREYCVGYLSSAVRNVNDPIERQVNTISNVSLETVFVPLKLNSAIRCFSRKFETCKTRKCGSAKSAHIKCEMKCEICLRLNRICFSVNVIVSRAPTDKSVYCQYSQ